MMSAPSEKTLSSSVSASLFPLGAVVSSSSSPAASKASSQALAQQRYNQAINLEKQLRVFLQTKLPFDSDVRDLRNSIRESYEAIILEDHEFAECHDVEQALWRLHYKQIEEFRARIRKGVPGTSATVSASVARAVPRKEPILKVLAIFKSFLSEATGFYHELILKLRAKYGLPQDYLAYEDPVPGFDETKGAELKKCQLSCHRCLIYLGDLARYKELHRDGDLRSHDWSVAANYYLKAVSLWPSSGNPHNQLAVLATYVNDELLAVYHYFRSLAVDNPFSTARDNLILLFEKNRQHYAQLPPATGEASVLTSKMEVRKTTEKSRLAKGDKMLPLGDGVLKLAVKDYNQQSIDSKGLPSFLSEIRKNFRVRFVRLNGILFTRTSLETFLDVYSAAVCELEQLLSSADSTLEAGLGSEHRSGIGGGICGAAGVVQLVAILIFTVHNVNWNSNVSHASYAEVLQRSALFQHAFTAAFECVGRIMRRCIDARDTSSSPLLPAILVFMEWLACRPEMAVGSEMDEKQTNARSFFWKQCVTLLNRLCVWEEQNDVNGCLEEPLMVCSIDGVGENDGGFALWEDYELQGFSPLIPAHHALDYSRRLSHIPIGNRREQQIRLQRLLAAGKAVANALEDSGRGIFFEEDMGKFYLAGEMIKKENFRSVDAGSANYSPPVELGMVSEGFTSFTSAVVSSKENPAQVISEGLKISSKVVPVKPMLDEEEDEEVIVFKPALKEGPLQLSLVPSKSTEPGIEVSVGLMKDGKSITYSLSSSNGEDHAKAVEPDLFKGPALLSSQSSSVSQIVDPNPPVFNAVIVGNSNLKNSFLVPSQAASLLSNSLNVTSPPASSASPLHGVLSSSADNVNLGQSTSVKDVNILGTIGAHTLGSSISPQDWLNHSQAASTAFTSLPLGNWDLQAYGSLFANGPLKVSTSTGVIGQAKQSNKNNLWSLMPEFASFSNSSSNGMIQGPANGFISSVNLGPEVHTSVKEIPSVLPEVFSSANAFVSTAKLGSGNCYGELQNGIIGSTCNGLPEALGNRLRPNTFDSGKDGKILHAIAEDCLSSRSGTSFHSNTWAPKENTISTWSCPSGIRPPPGFGPLPMNPRCRNIEFPQSSLCQTESQQLSDIDEHQQIDDYTWLDDYKPTKPESRLGLVDDAFPSAYTADYGIWTGGINSNISSDIGSFPFPGMRSPQFRHTSELQKQNLGIELQQQLMLEHETEKLNMGLEHPPLYSVQKFLGEGREKIYSQQLLLQEQQRQKLWYGQCCSMDPFVT